MAEDTMFAEAVTAARAGEISHARDLLARLLRADSSNPDYWLWMSAVVESDRESVFCLRSVMKLRPNHPMAHLGLTVLGQLSSGVERGRPVKQQRAIPLPQSAGGSVGSLQDWWRLPRNRENAAIFSLGTAAVILLIVIGATRISPASISNLFAHTGPAVSTQRQASQTPSATIPVIGPSPTLHAGQTPSNLIPFSTFVGVQFTPTSRYDITPTLNFGPFQNAMADFAAGRYQDALGEFQSLAKTDSRSAQNHYMLAETYRMLWEMKESWQEYQTCIGIDPNYAPAYLGLAMWSKQNSPTNDYLDDIDRALQADPNYVDAYLERALWYFNHEDYDTALSDLTRANQLAPNNALVLVRLGRTQIHTGAESQALDNISRAKAQDPTILEGYLGLGEAYNALNQSQVAVAPLEVYTTYAADDISGWVQLGTAYIGSEKYPEAIKACTSALGLDVNSSLARICRGQAYRLNGDAQAAVDDLQLAVNRAPNWYDAEFQYGVACLGARRMNFAIPALRKAISLATTVEQTADAMGWLAQAYEAYNNTDAAGAEWQALMNLKNVPEYWRATAYLHFYGLDTPTPGPTDTAELQNTTPSAKPTS